MASLTWGVLAFGSPYPWAYTPLLVASAIVGVCGTLLGRTRIAGAIPTALAAIAAAIACQLVPLSESSLGRLSPKSIELIQQRELIVGFLVHPLSIDPSRTWLGLTFFAVFSILMIGTTRILTRRDAWRVASMITILGSTLAVVGIIQKAVSPERIYGFWEPWQAGSPFGPFVNKNHFAGWMLLGIPVGLGLLFALLSRSDRAEHSGVRDWLSSELAGRVIIAAFACLAMTLALALTFSRSGLLSLAVALLFGAVMIKRNKEMRRRWLWVVYPISLVLIVVYWVGAGRIVTRFAQFDFGDVNQRPAIWADTLRIVSDFWLTGTGLNTYGTSTLFYQTSVPGFHLQQAHNDYLQLAAEGGVLLCVPIVAAVIAFMISARRRLSQDVGSIWWIRLGATTGLIAVAVQSTFEFSLQMPANAALFAVVCGMVLHDSRSA